MPRIVDTKIDMYLRTNDEISSDPILHGAHEPVVQSLLQFLAEDYKDFFSDIGANVGLSSVHCGDRFARVDCVEPNQLIAAVLSSNLALNLQRADYHVHKVGLAARSGGAELLVPPHNFGGGFVLEGNDYDLALLAAKDQFARFDRENYKTQQVDLVDSAEWLAGLFKTYRESNLTTGVVKVDAEGFERTIVQSILEVLPDEFRVVIVIENWTPVFDHTPYASARHNLTFKVVQKKPPAEVGRIRRSLRFLRALISGVKYSLVELSEAEGRPDNVVLFVDPIGKEN